MMPREDVPPTRGSAQNARTIPQANAWGLPMMCNMASEVRPDVPEARLRTVTHVPGLLCCLCNRTGPRDMPAHYRPTIDGASEGSPGREPGDVERISIAVKINVGRPPPSRAGFTGMRPLNTDRPSMAPAGEAPGVSLGT